MSDEKLEFTTLDEFKNELLSSDPSFAERHQARQIQRQMLNELKQARLAQKLSQSDIAKRSGIKMQNISRLERGLVSPTIETLIRYAIAVGGSFCLQLKSNN
ncbi:helix-turn-helix domain-containing protein [Testudinibacter sp. TR-2022]|uniref:helix-turn-helix domain-containing protein n=1 Tax=Testudinibacter sp. TR-2022 TaxID=2585029 RepID=UPI00111872E9|nr:helix-turn-helix transcriptional regulator [Testudinibacter sp. TR-2022]TNH09111.1 helix-turn-helix transcriptional regulator [Pasteurellaceae bacterium Phil11]TNH21190.1 helix-turn-helix transcriptional regulator [Testudinibacter sp. TR-2022]TNH26414.1 helix-turn-helix transcriptional regulator [Testudinibacter sp. TR-2022]